MTKEEYNAKMYEYRNDFEKLWRKIVEDTNQFIKDNPGKSNLDIDSFTMRSVEHLSDDLCLSGAWIQDRLNGKNGIPNTNGYKGSLTKKIRKSLGYNT